MRTEPGIRVGRSVRREPLPQDGGIPSKKRRRLVDVGRVAEWTEGGVEPGRGGRGEKGVEARETSRQLGDERRVGALEIELLV